MKSSLEIYLMKNKIEDQELKELLENFDENIDRISKIIESLLFLNRRENAVLRNFNLKDLVEEIAFDLEELAEEKNIRIISKVESKEIYTSDILLERVLYNLGKNAISYNRDGGDVVFDFSEDDENYFIYVKDTGPGIDEGDRERVFDLFYRIDESRNKKTGGYGIGLNLVKNIVEKLGGKVLISDNLNEDGEIIGTVFKVILPKKVTT